MALQNYLLGEGHFRMIKGEDECDIESCVMKVLFKLSAERLINLSKAEISPVEEKISQLDLIQRQLLFSLKYFLYKYLYLFFNY